MREKRKLPIDWKRISLGDACFINPRMEKGFAREPGALTTFVPMEAVDEATGKISRRIARPYSEISNGYTFFKEGDILFAKITPCMQNGKCAIAYDLIDGVGLGSTEFHVLRPRPNIHREWVFCFLRSAEFRRRAEAHFEGSAGQQRVPTEFIERALIPLPPTLDDQITIANDLEGRMAEVEEMRQAALRQKEAVAAMQGAILRKAFPWKEGERLPEGWRWAKIASEVDNSVASFMKSNHSEKYFNYIDISSVDEITKQITGSTEIRVEEAPSRAKYVLRQNDIIVSTVRPNLNAVAMITEAQDGHIGSSGFCVVRPKRGHYPSYFFYHLISPRFVESVSEMVQGAMYPAIRDEDVKAFKIPLPANTEEEVSITARLDHTMGDIERLRQSADLQLEAIEALPGAILREVFDFGEEG